LPARQVLSVDKETGWGVGGMEKAIILALTAAVIVLAELYSRWTLRERK